MIEADVKEGHPFRVVGEKIELPSAELSLVLARSGVGKSAALINFALEFLLEGKQVLHYTAGMTSEKTHQYYQELFNDHIREYPGDNNTSWEDIYQNFLVVSYHDASNMIADLDGETGTVKNDVHLNPKLILVDGLEAHDQSNQDLALIKALAEKHNVPVVAAMTIHRHTDGSLDFDEPMQLIQAHSNHIYFLEPSPAQDRINLERITDEGNKLLPLYFCPHDLIFKNT